MSENLQEHLGVKWVLEKGKIKITWPSGLVSYCQLMSDEELKKVIEKYKVKDKEKDK